MSEERLFSDLPAALVDEVISGTDGVAKEILGTYETLRADHKHLRSQLEESGLLRHESSLDLPLGCTTCGVDGSLAVERLLHAVTLGSLHQPQKTTVPTTLIVRESSGGERGRHDLDDPFTPHPNSFISE